MRGARWGDRPDHQATGRDRQATSAPSLSMGVAVRAVLTVLQPWRFPRCMGVAGGWAWGCCRGFAIGWAPWVGSEVGVGVCRGTAVGMAVWWETLVGVSGSQRRRTFSSVRLEVVSAARDVSSVRLTVSPVLLEVRGDGGGVGVGLPGYCRGDGGGVGNTRQCFREPALAGFLVGAVGGCECCTGTFRRCG